MKIVIDVSPIAAGSTSGHKVRGIGKYISLLKDNIQKYDQDDDYIFTSHPNQVKKADLLHYPYFDPFFISLSLINKIKTIVTVHDIIPLVHRKYFPVGLKGTIKWNINKLLLKRVDGIITDSQASREDIAKVSGIKKEKIHVVYLDVDPEFSQNIDTNEIKKIKEKYALPDEFVIYVGDITWNKNLPRLVKAIKKNDIPLVMVGKALIEDAYDKSNPWNNDRNKVFREIKEDKRFIRLGFIETKDLVGLYKLAIALCMPSLDEGFGLPVLEAMRAGCAVITSKEGSLPEVAGNAAYFVEAADDESISEAIKKVTADKSLRNDLIKRGHEQANKFSLKKMMEQTVSVYNLYK